MLLFVEVLVFVFAPTIVVVALVSVNMYFVRSGKSEILNQFLSDDSYFLVWLVVNLVGFDVEFHQFV